MSSLNVPPTPMTPALYSPANFGRIIKQRGANLQETLQGNACTKAFIVFSIFLATVVAAVGIIALFASKGYLSASLGTMYKLKAVGEVNSYLMIIAGFALVILGITAWSCQSSKELKEQRSPA